MDEAKAVGELAASVFSIAKDVTVTGLLLWFVRMLLTGDVVRKGELEAALKDKETERQNGKYWEGKFHEERLTVKEHVNALRDTVETAMAIRRDNSRDRSA